MPWQHSIAGGQGNLVVASLNSPNYVAGSTGWSVKRDGSAEFNNLTIRGTFNGTNYTINASGEFFYSGTPASGNLIFAVASMSGTDPYGNGYSAGLQCFSTATDIRGQTALFKSTSPNTHGITVLQNDTTGTSNAAINVVSNNPNFSAFEVTGTETARGSIKIAHKGYAAGTDASASGLSIDLQTTVGGATGTQAQGIFITSTTDAIPGGNAITVRYNSQDWFVVKGNVGGGLGIVGIGVATGHNPSGMLEIAQKDTTTIGFSMTALAAGTDLIQLKDSGGTLRWSVNNAGNMSVRANAFFNSPVIFGSLSSDSGGGGGGVITLCHNTDPAANPAAGHVILYCDASGNLLARTQAGNIRTVAAV